MFTGLAMVEAAEVNRRGGRWPEAEELYRRALATEPELAAARWGLGELLVQQRRWPAAIIELRLALRAAPERAETHLALGAALRAMGKLDDAAARLQTAVKLQPGFAGAWEGLGETLLAMRDVGAADAFARAIELNPTALNYANRGQALAALERWDEAIESTRKAIELSPDWSACHKGLGSMLQWCGRLDEALVCFDRAIGWDPTNAEADSARLMTMLFHGGFSPDQLAAEHRTWGKRHTGEIARLPAASNDPSPDRRLRVGYVSPNFRSQAVVSFVLPILENHDPWEVEVFCYSDVVSPDPWTSRAKQHADEWRDTFSLNDAELASVIRADRIDILVELTGHIGGGRLITLAYKPAPVQVMYIGYQATSGVEAVDYFLTDGWADPIGQTDNYFVEKLYRLPEAFFCYEPQAVAPEVERLPMLENGFVTYGCLNNLAKVTGRTIALWSSIMRAVEGSRLILLAPNSREVDERIFAAFARGGIERSRVNLARRAPVREYLARYNQIDIALDPVPFNGHTTTCDAAWMGCPTVSLAGEIYAYRYGGAVMRAVGYGELVTTVEQQYAEVAQTLGQDTRSLSEIRASLRGRMKSAIITDGKRFTHNLEQAYRRMWRTRCQDDAARRV